MRTSRQPLPLTVGLRLFHAWLDSGVQGGFVCGNHGPERGNAIDERDRAVAESGLGAYRRLNQEAGNMNGCKGGSHARVMLVGEQPGNQEDLEGKPFVGSAGKLLGTL